MAAQAVALGLASLVVQVRGTWSPSAQRPEEFGGGSASLIGQEHFWRDLLSLQLRGVVLMVVAAILAASITTLLRHTGGLLGLFFAWFAVVENVVRIAGYRWGLSRWLITENVVAFLTPGGQRMMVGTRLGPQGEEPIEVLVSNLDALLYLGVITAVAAAAAAVLLRRRDL